MTYSLSGPALYQPHYAALGNLGAAEVSPACVAWVQEHYNVAEFERIRTQELPQLLAEAPKPPRLPNPQPWQPLPWSAFGTLGAQPVGYQEGDPLRDVIVRRRGA